MRFLPFPPALLVVGLLLGCAAASEAPLVGWETLARPDRLPEFKSAIEVGSISSYDRTGGNDDGFSGRYSFVRRESGGLVIADLVGPGVIYRLWTPTPTDDWMEFYFDGEDQPRLRIRFRDLFLGDTAPFVKPLVGYGVGGFFSYVPIAYERSCKILVRAERVQFYQINFARYGAGAGIHTYPGTPDAARAGQVARVRELWSKSGQDISPFMVPPGGRRETVSKHVSVTGAHRAVLFERKQGGRIVGLRLGPLDALARKERDLQLQIAFDGGPASVRCPLSDFFGCAWGEPATRSLLVGTTAREGYCYFPMPFSRSVKVELVSDQPAGRATEVMAEVMWAGVPRRANEGYFGAAWRRENPTRIGVPFTFLDTKGRGHIVGLILQAQGAESGKTLFFEGDDVTTIDGRLAVHGTGSEDFFNGGWYDVPDRWEKRLSFPLSGCLGYWKHLGRTGAYRMFVGDAYSFNESIQQTIEHSGEKNDIVTDYAGTTFFYAEHPSPPALPPAADRGAVDPKEAIFVAAWEIPIRAFPFEGTTLRREVVKVGTEEVRVLSVRGGGADWVGPPYLYITCNLPAAGRYSVEIEAVRGPEEGLVQLFQDEVPVGKAVDLFAEVPARTGRLSLGTIELTAGDNPVMFKLVGKNPRSAGVGLELTTVICRRID